MSTNINSQALLILTNEQGVNHLEATHSWKVMALRPDQLQTDQLLFLDVQLGVVTHVAFLDGLNPFTCIKLDNDGPVLYMPNVAHVEEVFEPICVATDVLRFIDQSLFSGSMALHHEAATIHDIDELYGYEFDKIADMIGALIVDELILNRRSITQTAAVRYCTESVSIALAQELEDHGSEIPGAPMEELPDTWADLGADESILALLNSAYDSIAVEPQ